MIHARSHNWWPAALTLAERAAMRRDASVNRESAPASVAAMSHANRWRVQRPFNRPELLARRLRACGLTEPEFDALVDSPPTAVSGDAERPRWVREVEGTDAIAREIAQRPERRTDADTDGL